MSQTAFVTGKTKTILADLTITAAVSAGGLVKLTSAAHGLETGDILQISGIVGTVEANGQWVITKVDANTFTLDNSVFATAYTSGGTAKHIGWACAGVNVDNTVFATKPDFTLQARVETLSSGANVRVKFEDAADTAFVTFQSLATFQAAGPIVSSADKMFTARAADMPDARMTASGNTFRVKFYISGGAGKAAKLSAWMTY